MQHIPFLKMHGCGNDFIVLDARIQPLPLLDCERLADRRFGIGCDQLVLLSKSTVGDVHMSIFNADGSEVNACGNATRCVGWLLMQEKSSKSVTIETKAGLLTAYEAGAQNVRVNMGQPRLDWQQIPLSEAHDTLQLPTLHESLPAPVAVSMGNPHAVFFVDALDGLPIADLGALLEHHPIFPERANISFAQILSPSHIRLRVWERGAGLTLACGTAACATLVAGFRRGLAGRDACIDLPGGRLEIAYDDDFVWMAGPVATSFEGRFALEDFAKSA